MRTVASASLWARRSWHSMGSAPMAFDERSRECSDGCAAVASHSATPLASSRSLRLRRSARSPADAGSAAASAAPHVRSPQRTRLELRSAPFGAERSAAASASPPASPNGVAIEDQPPSVGEPATPAAISAHPSATIPFCDRSSAVSVRLDARAPRKAAAPSPSSFWLTFRLVSPTFAPARRRARGRLRARARCAQSGAFGGWSSWRAPGRRRRRQSCPIRSAPCRGR